MSQTARGLRLAVLLVVGCGGESQAPLPIATPPPPPVVTIELRGATIAPTKADGEPWDGPTPLARSVIDGVVAKVLAAAKLTNPGTAIAEAFVPIVINGIKPPDPKGSTRVISGGVASPLVFLPVVSNSYSPTWNPPAAFHHVVLDDRASLYVALIDNDFHWDDPIGTVTISSSQLSAALASGQGQVVEIDVHDQNPQVLLVGVTVSRE